MTWPPTTLSLQPLKLIVVQRNRARTSRSRAPDIACCLRCSCPIRRPTIPPGSRRYGVSRGSGRRTVGGAFVGRNSDRHGSGRGVRSMRQETFDQEMSNRSRMLPILRSHIGNFGWKGRYVMPECGLPLPCESTVASDSNALTITNSGIGSAIRAIGTDSEESAAAVTAIHTGGGPAIAASANETEIAVGVLNNGGSIGVMGFCTRDSFSIGVHGESRVEGVGVHGECDPEGGTGVGGRSRDGDGVTGTSTTGFGVIGKSDIAAGGFGIADAEGNGVVGAGENGNGVFGIAEFGTGVVGIGTRGLNQGVYGNGPIGVFGESPVEGGTGVVGAGQFRAAFFDGDVHINGFVIFGDGGVRIDLLRAQSHLRGLWFVNTLWS